MSAAAPNGPRPANQGLTEAEIEEQRRRPLRDRLESFGTALRIRHARIARDFILHGIVGPNDAVPPKLFGPPLYQLIDYRMETPELVRYLVDHGADVNRLWPSDTGVAPLFQLVARLVREPAEMPNPDVVRILLDAGSDPNNAHWMTGETPLLGAITNGFSDISLLLLASGGDLNLRDGLNRTPLQIAERALRWLRSHEGRFSPESFAYMKQNMEDMVYVLSGEPLAKRVETVLVRRRGTPFQIREDIERLVRARLGLPALPFERRRHALESFGQPPPADPAGGAGATRRGGRRRRSTRKRRGSRRVR